MLSFARGTMRKVAILIHRWCAAFGVNFFKMGLSLLGIPWFIWNLITLLRQRREFGVPRVRGFYPCMDDRFAQGGNASGHYFHQDLLVAQSIFRDAPELHCDVGSRVDGFVAHVASFRKITVFDVRSIDAVISNVTFCQADMMAPLDSRFREYCDSLSCLHALEHFGLGRYGDPVNINGHLAGLKNLQSMLKPGGTLYLSVPIGPQRIDYNAHRVFSVKYLLDILSGDFCLKDFSFVDDNGVLHAGVAMDDVMLASEFDCYYGCGIFTLRKL